MTRNMKILAAILGVIVILYFISQSGQKKYQTQSNSVFSIVMEEVYRFKVEKDSIYIYICSAKILPGRSWVMIHY